MKFAKELEQDLVPEWRAKYLDYKTGKKKVKAVTRAIQKTKASPRTPSLRHTGPISYGADHQRPTSSQRTGDDLFDPLSPRRTNNSLQRTPRPKSTPRQERQPLQTPKARFSEPVGSYGSILNTPPEHALSGSDGPHFELPDPAIDPDEEDYESPMDDGVKSPSPVLARRNTDIASTKSNSNRTSHLLRRVFSTTENDGSRKKSQADPVLEVQKRQDEFFLFLDTELEKIDSFYRMKEKEATNRLKILRQQLHVMRDQRLQEILVAKGAARRFSSESSNQQHGFIHPSRLKDTITGKGRIGKNSRALAEMATPRMNNAQDRESIQNRSDFMRREEPLNNEVSYRSAKRKLKHALQEFYRGIELLKGYAYLNRTAFRKINKKYDKAVNSRPPLRYMSEKVNSTAFVQSDVVDSLMVAVEDLYSRYFESGNRKIAVSKLRHGLKNSGDYSPSTFRAGLLLMAGILFSIQGLVYAAHHLHGEDLVVHLRTSYLLQIYGGYFLIVFHVLLFCLDCMVWTKSRINFAFVFEYDTRNALEWRQFLEIPAFLIFLLGLFLWLNFSWINSMYIYWPVVLIGVTLIVVLLPAPVLYHRSRKWWAFSNWRLLLAGFYPVEFRDFFLGDMYCSQTYAMGNIELFFCLYASFWGNPTHCNSSHSRLLGFFTCLPSIWRAFQCIRRYVDTKNAFPHLLNLAKYICGILYYATLSMYRINKQTRFQAAFITFALLNASFVSVWDLIMDWSLGNPYAKHPLLRDVLAFRHVWVYYVAMVFNVIIRFNWIFYAIFANDMQHSAALSFFVAFSEVIRRGVWSIFRVENEHCTNVLTFRASRDVPLPYELQTTSPGLDGSHSNDLPLQEASPLPADVEVAPPPNSTLRARTRRPSVGLLRIGSTIAQAHAQDFQRRRPQTSVETSDEEDEGEGSDE
ncbi:hypothetical protein N7495_001143 [Penicillium taxi]|uniref:uncharacterized protein n=1 Tax=Penicillium taxi TaxID=168475 RepID=UPI002544DBCE|nr:uncharacterized protein N7495_001143 [Penicillium taxi]KAJ5908461.1 hypothetical protein N7495_001143 [Penicillium taxi]